MATVMEGNPVTLDHRFGLGGQPSPDAVTFNVRSPDGTHTAYVFGVDPQVTNPSTDYYECALGVLPEIDEYIWDAVGSVDDEVVETAYGTVFVITNPENPTQLVPPGPMLGPAVTWIVGEDVARCATWDWGSNPAIFDYVAVEASMALYEISGRKFPGMQPRRVRPCRNNCPCWGAGPPSYGLSPFWWTGSAYGVGGGWAWYNERGDQLGCNPESRINLAGYPVREITEVLIDGEELPEFDIVTGARNWRLDQRRYLVRMDTPAIPPSTTATPQFWPGCQNMSLDADQPGTFEIAYKWGIGPPELGRDAAVELALQLYLACAGKACVLPAGVTKVERQGITIERGLLANWMDPTMGTGLVAVDMFLQSYNQGMKRGRVSAVYSPDLQTMARKVGNQ